MTYITRNREFLSFCANCVNIDIKILKNTKYANIAKYIKVYDCGWNKHLYDKTCTTIDIIFIYIDSTCGISWTSYNANCYKFVERTYALTWPQAEDSCQELGGHLVSIMDKLEMSVLHYLLTTKWRTDSTRIYIGKPLWWKRWRRTCLNAFTTSIMDIDHCYS